MAVRLNSESKIDNNLFTLKIGTTNKLNPQVIYVEGRTFISPKEDKESYDKDVREIKVLLQRKLSSMLNENDLFERKYILDFQLANSGIRMGKKSFLSFEFLLKQKNKPLLKFKEIKNNSIDFISEVVSTLKLEIEKIGFNITKTKNVVIKENAILLHS